MEDPRPRQTPLVLSWYFAEILEGKYTFGEKNPIEQIV